MFLTKEDAQKRICPFSWNCIGPKCMAWRWEPETQTDIRTKGLAAMNARYERKGYCGLAGKPEATDAD